MTSKFANIEATKSVYIQNPPSSQRQDVNGGLDSNRPSNFYPNNNEERPVGFSNPLYGSKADASQPSERPTQQGNNNRPSILPSKDINLNKDTAPFRLNPGFTIAGEGNQNRATLLSQQFDSMMPLNKTTEANLQRIAEQVNQESQIKTTKKLDNYQFGVRGKQDVDLDVKENASSEFYSNLAIKGKNMMDLLQSLSDSTVFSDETYKSFKIKRANNKQEINQFEGEIISKQDIEDLSTLYTELKVIDALALSVDKYADLAAEAVKLSQFFREQGIEVNPKEYLDLDTEFVNIHDSVSKEQQILKANLEKFLEIWKAKPNTPDCEEKAHILFKGLQDHKKVYQSGWDKCAKLMTLVANIFEEFAKDVYRNTNNYKTKIAKLKNCKHEIELADSYNKKLLSIGAALEKDINVLKRVFAIGKTNNPSLDKAGDYIDQLSRINENIKFAKNDLAKIRYHIKNFGDPCSVEVQYFQVFRYRLRDQLEFTLIDCDRKIDLIRGLGEALFALEKCELKIISMYTGEEGIQKKLDAATRELQAKIEAKRFANDAEKMAEIKRLCKLFNTMIGEYALHLKKIKSFLENSEISDALGTLLTAFTAKLNELIKNCTNESEKVFKMRFIASEIDNQFKTIESSTNGSIAQYTKFLNAIVSNNLYQSSEEITNQQSWLQKTMSETRKECVTIESLLSKTTNPETKKKIQAMIANLKTNDENLLILDEVLNATGKIKLTLENFTEKTKSSEIVRYIELNASNIKDEKNFLDQVSTKLLKFQNEKAGKDFEVVLGVSNWYSGQFISVSQIYQLTTELFTKKLPKIRALPDSSKELEAAFKEFSTSIYKELDSVKDKLIRSRIENILPKWGDILRVKVKEESSQIQYRSDSLIFLQEKLDRLELYNFVEFEDIRGSLEEIRKKHNHSSPSTIESILTDLVNLKHHTLQDSILNICYDFKNETELSTYLTKTLAVIAKSIQEKAENHDFDHDFGDSAIKNEFLNWGLEISKAIISLQKLLENLFTRLNDFHTNKLFGRYQNVKDFLSDFMQTYDDIIKKFSPNNQHFKNFSKFSPVLDVSGFYLKYYEFDSSKYKTINEFTQAYTKYVDAVKKYGNDLKNYLNRNSELMRAKKTYDSCYENVLSIFGSVINMSQKIEEIFEKDQTVTKIIETLVEMAQRDAEDINLKLLNDHYTKLEAYKTEVFHGDLEDGYIKVFPDVIKALEQKVNAPKPPEKLATSQASVGQSQNQVQNSNQLPKSNTVSQTAQPTGGNYNSAMPKRPPTLNTDEDDDVN